MFLLKAIILYITNQTILADTIPPNFDLVNTVKVSNLGINYWTGRRSLRRLAVPKPPKAPTKTAKKPPPPKSKTPTSSKGKTGVEGPEPPPNRNGTSNAQRRNGSSKTDTVSNRNGKSNTQERNAINKKVHFEEGTAMKPKSSKNPIKRMKDKIEARRQKKIAEKKAKLDEESFEILYKGTQDLIDYHLFDQHDNMRMLHRDTTQYLIELNEWLPTTKTYQELDAYLKKRVKEVAKYEVSNGGAFGNPDYLRIIRGIKRVRKDVRNHRYGYERHP